MVCHTDRGPLSRIEARGVLGSEGRMLRRLAFLPPLLVASTAFAAPPPLPSPASPSGGGATATPTPAIDFDALRKGVVQVEQSGRPIAIGTVLSKDGRVLTSLSGLGAATEPEIRYSD